MPVVLVGDLLDVTLSPGFFPRVGGRPRPRVSWTGEAGFSCAETPFRGLPRPLLVDRSRGAFADFSGGGRTSSSSLSISLALLRLRLLERALAVAFQVD